MSDGFVSEFCRFRIDDEVLFSWIELIVRARTEPGEKSDGSIVSDDDGGRTISPLKRRVRKDGDWSQLFWLFINWVLIDKDSNVDIGWLVVSVAELVRLRGEGFLRDEINRLSFVIVWSNKNKSSLLWSDFFVGDIWVVVAVVVGVVVDDGGKKFRRGLINVCAWLRTNTNKDLYPGLIKY
jgi:hypothetical protein